MFRAAIAIDYIHSKNMCYSDLKKDNLLIFKDLNVKLGDFGFSQYFPEEGKKKVILGAHYRIDNDDHLLNKEEMKTHDYHGFQKTFKSA